VSSCNNDTETWLNIPQDFQQHFVEKLEKGGDVARDSKNHDVAIGLYSSALSLNPENISNIVVKLCKARLSLLEDELRDITKVHMHGFPSRAKSTALTYDQVTACDPLNYKGHKSKHAVLHSMGRYEEAFEAFGMMMSSMGNSPDPQIRGEPVLLTLPRGYGLISCR
jgi:tetratricopeptide (TPR) repeat protein